MENSYTDKIFEFSKFFNNSNEFSGNIKVVQVGETCLDRGACIKEHIQMCHEITLVVSGSGVLTAEQERIQCNAGDIQIVSKGTVHGITAGDDAPLRYIHFAFEFLDYKPKILSEFYGQCKNIIIHDNRELKVILNMLVEEYFGNASFTDIMRGDLIELLLITLWRRVNMQVDKYQPIMSEEPMGKVVYNIIKYIDRHLSEQITVSSIAKHFSYSRDYISRLFKSKTGVSLKEYIITIRMNYAEYLLKEGQSSLEEISRMIGYESVQSFCKQFKKYTGNTPGKIRK